MTDDLKFPVSNESFPPPPKVSMEAYVQFVEMNLQWFGYSQKKRQEIIQELVEVPFRL